MCIDIHVHTRLFPTIPRPASHDTYASPEQLFAAYDEIGVERAVLLPGMNPECSTGVQSNEESLHLAKITNGRFIPFCNADPRMMSNSGSAPFDYFFKYYRDLGCKGIGEMCCNLRLLDPLMQNMFKGAEASGLPLTFHVSPYIGYAYGVVDDAGLPGLETCLQRFPKLRFFGHSQAFWSEIGVPKNFTERVGYPKGAIEEEGAVPRLMRKYPNLYGDLSAGSGCNALARDRKYAAKFLAEFQDRLFFGTDVCQPSMPTMRPLAKLLQEMRANGEITETVFQKVARENAIRELGL